MISNVIEKILYEIPETRSSDARLWIEVAKNYGLYLTPDQVQKFLNIPPFETIRRTRQKIQESGKYPATDRIRRHRKFKSIQVQQRISQTAPEKVDNLLNADEANAFLQTLKTPKQGSLL